MKKILITCLCIIVSLSVFNKETLAQKTKAADKNRDDNRGNSSFGQRHVPGTWSAYIEDEKIYIDFTGADWNSGRTFLLSDLGTLPTGSEGTFSMTRESGTVTFKGEFESGKGRGFYKFAPNTSFKTYLEQKGYKDLNEELMLHIFFTDINKGYFDFLNVNGYAKVSNNQLKDLAEQDLNRKVMVDYFDLFKAEGYGHQTLDKIVELREHGVNASFVNSFHQMGFKSIPLDKVLELRDHGVTPGFINQFTKMGYKNISLDEAQDLRDHGVSPEFINSIQDMGYKGITLDKAQELRDHGVNVNFIKSIQALGFKDLSLDKAQELVDHGVTASYIQKMKSKGTNSHTLDDYIRLRDNGVNE